MAVLLVDRLTKDRIDDVVAYAASSPLHVQSLTEIFKTDPTALQSLMATYTVKIPVGYQATYTQEIHPNSKRFHHISVSVDRPKKLPSHEAVWAICQEFKIISTDVPFNKFAEQISHLDIETVNSELQAVNIWVEIKTS